MPEDSDPAGPHCKSGTDCAPAPDENLPQSNGLTERPETDGFISAERWQPAVSSGQREHADKQNGGSPGQLLSREVC